MTQDHYYPSVAVFELPIERAGQLKEITKELSPEYPVLHSYSYLTSQQSIHDGDVEIGLEACFRSSDTTQFGGIKRINAIDEKTGEDLVVLRASIRQLNEFRAAGMYFTSQGLEPEFVLQYTTKFQKPGEGALVVAVHYGEENFRPPSGKKRSLWDVLLSKPKKTLPEGTYLGRDITSEFKDYF